MRMATSMTQQLFADLRRRSALLVVLMAIASGKNAEADFLNFCFRKMLPQMPMEQEYVQARAEAGFLSAMYDFEPHRREQIIRRDEHTLALQEFVKLHLNRTNSSSSIPSPSDEKNFNNVVNGLHAQTNPEWGRTSQLPSFSKWLGTSGQRSRFLQKALGNLRAGDGSLSFLGKTLGDVFSDALNSPVESLVVVRGLVQEAKFHKNAGLTWIFEGILKDGKFSAEEGLASYRNFLKRFENRLTNEEKDWLNLLFIKTKVSRIAAQFNWTHTHITPSSNGVLAQSAVYSTRKSIDSYADAAQGIIDEMIVNRSDLIDRESLIQLRKGIDSLRIDDRGIRTAEAIAQRNGGEGFTYPYSELFYADKKSLSQPPYTDVLGNLPDILRP